MASHASGPIRGIRTCDKCGLPETAYGYSARNICQCGIPDASRIPRDPNGPKFFPGMFGTSAIGPTILGRGREGMRG
jgi:hypothetical protein